MKVKKIKDVGEEEVYDISVDKINSFSLGSGGGCIVHNSRHFLGWDMQTFEETLGDNINFQYVEPELAVDYAGADALSTFVLAGATLKFYKESKMAGKIDNKLLYPLMKWEDHPLPIDYKYLERILLDAQETKKELEREVHSMVGYSFNIDSGQQLSEALEKLGLHTGEYTKAGYMRTPKDLISKLDHPISDKIIEYKELSKMISSYISNMSEYAKKENGKLRFAYKNTRVPTGRLACGGDKKNEYFAKLNLQSIPKSSSEMWYVHKAEEKHSDDDNVIMGYRFSKEDKSDVVAEGFDPYLNVRKAFKPENDNFYWVSVDFSSQELRIPCNLSKEPVWLEAFNSEEGDPHKATAIKLFGEENYDRDKRKKAKGMNFGLLYGMSKYTVKDKFGMDTIEEAESFVNQYKSTLNTLFAWEERMKKNARKNGTVYTYFGRPRRLKWYFNHKKSGMRAFGYRSAINSPIQGAGSDILKIALVKLWDNVFTNSEYMEDVIFMSTVHDEINFSVRKNKVENTLPAIMKNMEIEVPGWQVAMEADFEIGSSWGQIFEFEYNDEGEIVPSTEPAEDYGM